MILHRWEFFPPGGTFFLCWFLTLPHTTRPWFSVTKNSCYGRSDRTFSHTIELTILKWQPESLHGSIINEEKDVQSIHVKGNLGTLQPKQYRLYLLTKVFEAIQNDLWHNNNGKFCRRTKGSHGDHRESKWYFSKLFAYPADMDSKSVISNCIISLPSSSVSISIDV